MDDRNRWSEEAMPATRRRFGRKRFAVCAAAGALGLLIGPYGYYEWTAGRYLESTDDAYVGGDVTPISARVSGLIAEVDVVDNQKVKAGQVLLRLDDRDERAALGHAEAALREREAALDALRAQYLLQRSSIAQASFDVVAKIAQASFAKIDAQRYRALASDRAGSQQDAQRTLASDEGARAAVSSAKAALAGAKQRLNVLSANIEEATASVAQANADLRTARLNLRYDEIRAPLDGYVGDRAARVGAYAAQGSYLLSIVPAQGLWVEANFKEDQLARMKPGQRATIVADAAPGHVFHGRVASLAPATGAVFSVIPPENATGNFTRIVQRVPVRITLDGGGSALGRLRPGLSIDATVDTRADAGTRQ